MKNFTLTIITLFTVVSAKAQPISPNHKFAPDELKADLAYLKVQLFNAHANPFSEISKSDYEQLFQKIDHQLSDSLTATAFYKTIKPAISYLSDEHAQISISDNLKTDEFRNGNLFLPITLSREGNNYLVNEQLVPNTGLKKGDVIKRINNQPIGVSVSKCTRYTPGFPSQRADNALQQFGYLYALTNPQNMSEYPVKLSTGKTLTVKGTTFKTWLDYIVNKAGQTANTADAITYAHYGNAGYITTRAFNARNDKEMDAVKSQLATIFEQIRAAGVQTLFIDVSKNSGGNSAVGDVLINYFYSKPYRNYQCNWKRSDEYLALLKSWGMNDAAYESQPAGKIIHFDSAQEFPANPNPYRFNGKVYIVIGNGTFSSAIMFATVVNDNHMATLIGHTPKDGHPNHFGELYSTQLPHTKLDVRFGVKEWIRPAGKSGENILKPDIQVDVNQSPEEIIKQVLK